MKLEIEIDDDELREMIMKRLCTGIIEESFNYESRICRNLFREAAKEMLYNKPTKTALIEDAVSRAAAELTRKGLPLLLAKMEATDGKAD